MVWYEGLIWIGWEISARIRYVGKLMPCRGAPRQAENTTEFTHRDTRVAVDWFKSTVRVTGSKFDDPRKAESQD